MNQNSKIAVLGYGVESQSTCAYLKAHGYTNVTVFDTRQHVVTLEGFPCIFGDGALKNLVNMDVVFRTPGITYNHPDLIAARASGVEITSQLEFFLEHAKGTTIGITGTKGKTTTATFMHHLLHEAGLDAYLVGNMGNGMLDVLDDLEDESISIMELSSFQLMGCRRSPHIAVALAMTPEHLDYHKDLEEYYASKYSITAHQSEDDTLIVYKDNHVSHEFGEKTKARVYHISSVGEVDHGAYLDGDRAILRWDMSVEEVPFDHFAPVGRHQRTNALPGLMVARLCGVDHYTLQKAMNSFLSVEHRLEYVGKRKGVTFYNDSAGTTPESAIAALKAMDKPTWVILGGSEKGVDFSELAAYIADADHVRGVFFVGSQSGPRIRASIEETGVSRETKLVSVCHFSDLPTTFASYVSEGEVILLAPAAASFDEFQNYKERGECFKAMAKAF